MPRQSSQWTASKNPWEISYERYQIEPEIQLPDDNTSLLDMLEQSFAKFATHDAYICQNQYLTYQQLDIMSLKVASYLQQSGRQQGDKIGVMLPNILQYPIIALSILRAGMVLVNINPLYTPKELAYQLHDAEVTTLFILERFLPTLQQMTDEAAASPSLDNIIICRAGDMFGRVKGTLVNAYFYWVKTPKRPSLKAVKNGKRVKDILQSTTQDNPKKPHYFNQILTIKNPSYQRPNVTLDDIALLQYTGGTTGVAKGAMLTHGNLIANVLQMNAWMKSGYDDEGDDSKNAQDIVLTALPLYHIFAFTICCMFLIHKGYTGLLIPNPRDTKGLIKQLANHPVSFLLGVNTLFSGLLAQPAFQRLDFSGLKATIGGGMAISPAIAQQWHMLTGTPIIEGYGLSETSPVVTFNPITIAEFTNKIGIPAPSTDVKIINDRNKTAAIGERGELVVKGAQVMKGYYNRPYETFQAFTPNGYLRTGDIGIMDERGFIKIVDRKKDMLLVSGFNVYPHEIEEVVSQHPDVAECAVIGIPNTVRGEEPKLYVVRKLVKNQASVSEAEILEYARARLTGYKRPRSVQFVEKLPKSNVGKILRKELRKMEGLE